MLWVGGRKEGFFTNVGWFVKGLVLAVSTREKGAIGCNVMGGERFLDTQVFCICSTQPFDSYVDCESGRVDDFE